MVWLGFAMEMRGAQAVARRFSRGVLAAAIAFLASKDAGYLNGAILPVDGGWFTA